jgi:hypothetical protein
MGTIVTGEGPRLARRPLLAACALLGIAPRLALAKRMEDGAFELELDDFLAEAVPLASRLVLDKSSAGQDRYLLALAALAAGLRDVPVPEMNETTNYALLSEKEKASPARTFLGVNECDAPFTLLHWRLEPGARIGLHPHIYGNVLTVCLEGEVRIHNYEMTGQRDFDTREPFQVRRTKDQVLVAGDMNTVNLEHGYVHGFVAGPSGARGLDITTRIREKRPTPTLVVGGAQDDARALFEARWKQP